MLCEMQSVRSRIWTRVVVSLSCDDNHYITGTSNEKYVYLFFPIIGSNRWEANANIFFKENFNFRQYIGK